jgi:hypothetical protein
MMFIANIPITAKPRIASKLMCRCSIFCMANPLYYSINTVRAYARPADNVFVIDISVGNF